jgi:hypothetical protein
VVREGEKEKTQKTPNEEDEGGRAEEEKTVHEIVFCKDGDYKNFCHTCTKPCSKSSLIP